MPIINSLFAITCYVLTPILKKIKFFPHVIQEYHSLLISSLVIYVLADHTRRYDAHTKYARTRVPALITPYLTSRIATIAAWL